MAGVVEVILKLKDGSTQTLKSVGGAAEDADKKLKSASKAGSGFVVTMGDVAGAARLAAESTFGVAQEIADLRNELTDMSTRTGVAAETLAGLKLAAEGSGLQLSEFNEALGQLPKKMNDVAKGGGEAKGAFEALGVSATDSNGRLRDADTVLRELVKGLQATEDPTTRAALAVELFGESGGKLMQALGSSDLESFVQFSRVFGADVGPQAAKAAGDWQRNMAELQMVFDGFKAGLVDFFGGAGGIGDFTLGIITAGTFLNGFFAGLFEGVAIEFDRFIGYMTSQVTNFMTILDALKRRDIGAAGRALAQGFGNLGSYLAGGDPLSNVLKAAGNRAMADVNAIVPSFIEGRAAMAAAGGAGGAGAPGAGAQGPRGESREKPVFVDIDMSEDLAKMAEIVETRSGGRNVGKEDAAERMAELLGQLRTGAGAAGSFLSGDLAGLAGMAGGPVGSVAAMAIPLLQQLGDVGAAGVKDAIAENARSIIAGIRELPELISEVIPDLVAEIVPEFVTALLESLPELIAAQYKLVANLIILQFVRLPQAIAQAFTEAFIKLWENIRSFFSDLFTVEKGEVGRTAGKAAKGALRVGAAVATFGLSEVGLAVLRGVDNGLENSGRKGLPGFATGGHVTHDGVYRLHRNEYVVPANGAAPSGAFGRGGGGVGGINFFGPVYGGHEGKRELIRELRQMLGAGGLGESLGD